MENYFALAKAGVVNWVIEAAFLRVATIGRKKRSREFKSHVVFLSAGSSVCPSFLLSFCDDDTIGFSGRKGRRRRRCMIFLVTCSRGFEKGGKS